jgi:hypothetical protein
LQKFPLKRRERSQRVGDARLGLCQLAEIIAENAFPIHISFVPPSPIDLPRNTSTVRHPAERWMARACYNNTNGAP